MDDSIFFTFIQLVFARVCWGFAFAFAFSGQGFKSYAVATGLGLMSIFLEPPIFKKILEWFEELYWEIQGIDWAGVKKRFTEGLRAEPTAEEQYKMAKGIFWFFVVLDLSSALVTFQYLRHDRVLIAGLFGVIALLLAYIARVWHWVLRRDYCAWLKQSEQPSLAS